MADAEAADDDGDRAVLLAHLVQAGAATGDDHVHITVEAQQLPHQRPIRVVDVLHGPGRQAGRRQCVLDHPHQLQVGVEGLTAAAQYAGVAGLEAEAGDVDGDVGTRLVDDTDDTDGHPTAGEAQAVLQHPAVDLGADRIVEHYHLAHIRHYPGQPLWVEQQPIQHSLSQASLAARRYVLGVGGQDLLATRLQFIGDGGQRPVLLRRADGGKLIGGFARRLPHFLQTHDLVPIWVQPCSSTMSSL
ncbi:hypothetical protein D3C79_692170 [compost metagenome]